MNWDLSTIARKCGVRQGDGFHVLAHGNWYQDDVLNYMHAELESFTWQDDNNFYIDVK